MSFLRFLSGTRWARVSHRICTRNARAVLQSNRQGASTATCWRGAWNYCLQLHAHQCGSLREYTNLSLIKFPCHVRGSMSRTSAKQCLCSLPRFVCVFLPRRVFFHNTEMKSDARKHENVVKNSLAFTGD